MATYKERKHHQLHYLKGVFLYKKFLRNYIRKIIAHFLWTKVILTRWWINCSEIIIEGFF